MEDDTDEEDMEYVRLDDERERHWKMGFEDNYEGVDDKKALLYAKRWAVYVNEKEDIIQGGYSVEVLSSDGKKVLWEVVDSYVTEEENYHDEIGLRGFDFNLFDKDKEGVGREGLINHPYLLIPMKICPGNWNNYSKRININVDEDNGKAAGMVNGRYQKFRQFSGNEFWNNVVFLV